MDSPLWERGWGEGRLSSYEYFSEKHKNLVKQDKFLQCGNLILEQDLMISEAEAMVRGVIIHSPLSQHR
jgi:hypothetical protein